jgi:molecular chaperone GrpE
MKRRDRKEVDPPEGAPNSEDAFSPGAGSAEDGELELDDPADESSDESSAVAASSSVLERQLAEQQERYLRLAAEYDNYRKRTARERSELSSRAQGELVKELLDALDDLARFAHVDPASTDAETIVQGVDMVEKKFLKTLTAAGLDVVFPINQSFDPTLHEAVATEPALSPEDDHVVARVFQAGYLFNGQLLRPARVVVKQWNG